MIFSVCLTNALVLHAEEYEPQWKSLARHKQAPKWFRDAKFGIYFHWGPYSVPAFGNEHYPRTMYGHVSGKPPKPKKAPRRVLVFRHIANMIFIFVRMGSQRILNITICSHCSLLNRSMLRSGRISFFWQGRSLLAPLQCITMVLPCGIPQLHHGIAWRLGRDVISSGKCLGLFASDR